ncbi:DUF3081 domain-containing protein [Planctobacterium marinum]|uniref:DUF3081 domain-containing protein n=1 Tax=Planctobacterium marinum TaxID=1631968 RepID=UPI001E624F82|nr:DUF3081 domain-containing protein [Planctobacterium marinum]MCC2605850.1 DUF3081 domain-containing protein [Planctobacterium marinum]
MKNEIDSKLILAVFEKIRLHGEQSEEGYLLDGVRANTDFDGYTLYLSDALVSLSFGFHNQYHFDYESPEHFEQFYKKLSNINQQY